MRVDEKVERDDLSEFFRFIVIKIDDLLEER